MTLSRESEADLRKELTPMAMAMAGGMWGLGFPGSWPWVKRSLSAAAPKSPHPCSHYFLSPSQVCEHKNWAVEPNSSLSVSPPMQEDLRDIENIRLAFALSSVGLSLKFLYHHPESRFLLTKNIYNWRVYWLLSQGNRLNVSTRSLLFISIWISLSPNRVSREYDWEVRVPKSSMEDPSKEPLPCWPKTCSRSHSLLSRHMCLAPQPSSLFGGRSLADLVSIYLTRSPQRQRCCITKLGSGSQTS